MQFHISFNQLKFLVFVVWWTFNQPEIFIQKLTLCVIVVRVFKQVCSVQTYKSWQSYYFECNLNFIFLFHECCCLSGIIDPNANHRLPVEAAYNRNLFDKRLQGILEDPSDDTRGFFDPNTEENLTYLELMERFVVSWNGFVSFLIRKIHKIISKSSIEKK